MIINHEMMCYLNSRKGKKGFLAVKVCMRKAYDMVEWDVLKVILGAHGFSEYFSTLVLNCISTAQYSVLINGSPMASFSDHKVFNKGTHYHLLYSLYCLTSSLEL